MTGPIQPKPEVEQDGFITVHHFPPCGIPRNHAEEIANARAGFTLHRGNRADG